MDAETKLWMPECNGRRLSLIESIDRAFPKSPPPGEALFENDDPYTYRLIEMHLLGKTWYEIDLREWLDFGRQGRSVTSDSLNSDSTYMLTPAGWAYYIPCYMIFCLTAIDPDVHLGDVVSHMRQRHKHHDFGRFVSLLTPAQIEVCKEFLSFAAECHIFGGYEDAAIALKDWPVSK